jgi:transposase
MAGVYQLEITETEKELKELLKKEKTGSGKERIQVLYLLKSGQAQTITQASELVGRHRVTVQDWLRKYRQGGIEKLRSRASSPGRTPAIPLWARKALAKRLEAPEGFESYGAICQW